MTDKRNMRTGSSAVCLLYSVLIASLAFVLIALIFSVVAFCTDDPLSLIKPLSIGAILLSAIVGSLITARLYGVPKAMLSALILTLVILLIGTIAKRGALEAGALINYGCYMAVSALTAYIASRKPSRHARRKRR